MRTDAVSVATRDVAPARGGLRHLPTLAWGVDLALISASVLVALLGRQALDLAVGVPASAVGGTLSIGGPLMILGWVAMIFLFGGYRPEVFGAGLDEFKRTINASLGTAALVGIICYAARYPLPRSFFLLVFGIGIPMLVAGRFLLRRSVQRARRNGALLHRVVIAGSEGHIDEIASVLRRETWLGYDVVGALTPGATSRPATHSGIPLLGSSDSVARVALEVEADVIFLAGGAFDSGEHVRRLAWALEREDVQVVIAPSVTDLSGDRVRVRPVGGLPLIHLESPRSEAAVRRAKRTFDLIAGVVLLTLAVPLLLAAAARVWHHDRGPILVHHLRVGRDGRMFRAWSLRTTHPDAAQQGGRPVHADARDELFEPAYDPYLTVPGRWLRRYHLHELPQLLNVVLGQMSLVGPRVLHSHEVPQMDETDRRLAVRPGLTGVWRDFRRSDLSWSEAVTLDLHYAENWSMLQDLDLLARTISAIVREGSTR